MALMTVSEAAFVATVSCGLGTLSMARFTNLPDHLLAKLIAFYTPMMPYGTATAKTGDPYEFVEAELEKLSHSEIIDLLSN